MNGKNEVLQLLHEAEQHRKEAPRATPREVFHWIRNTHPELTNPEAQAVEITTRKGD